MGLISLGKTTANNVTGSYTPNFLLTGMLEINQGNGALVVNSATNVADGGIFVIKIHQPEAYGIQEVSWASSYCDTVPGSLFQGYADPGGADGERTCWTGFFLQDEGRSFLFRSVYTDS
jgi:hypothetical protein